MLKITGKRNFKCKLRYLEAPKQKKIKNEKCFSNGKHFIQTIKIPCQDHRIEALVCNSWFHLHRHSQYDFPGKRTNSLPHDAAPKVAFFVSSTVLLQKKYPGNVLAAQMCMLTKHGKSSLHIIALQEDQSVKFYDLTSFFK